MIKSCQAILAVCLCFLVGGPVAKADVYPISQDGFWISPEAVTFAQAAAVIASYNGKYADITTDNFLVVTNYVLATLGPNSSVWIHSWNNDTYDGSPLQLTVESSLLDSKISVGSAEAVHNVLIYDPKIVPEPGPLSLGLVAALLLTFMRWVSRASPRVP